VLWLPLVALDAKLAAERAKLLCATNTNLPVWVHLSMHHVVGPHPIANGGAVMQVPVVRLGSQRGLLQTMWQLTVFQYCSCLDVDHRCKQG
jgi:hypothetical protein